MLNGPLAVFLNFAGIAAMAAISTVLLLSLLWPVLKTKLTTLSLKSRKFVLWSWVCAPWLIACSTALSFLPSITPHMGNWFGQVAHWHHPDTFVLTSWHALLLYGIFAVTLLQSFKAFRRWHHGKNKLNTLLSLTGQQVIDTDQGPLHIISTHEVSAFTAGMRKPACYITSGLVRKLDTQEQSIVIGHEQAHVEQKDTLFKFLFNLLAGYFPKTVAKALSAEYGLLTELLADARVARRHGNDNVAAALVKVAKIQHAGKPATSFSYFGASDLTTRVQALMMPQAQHALPRSLILATAVLMMGLSTVTVDSLHHLIESIFSH